MREPLITRDQLLRRLEDSGSYPAVPLVAVPIIKLANEESTSFHQLAAIIEKDPVISARILKVANSELYGFRKEITSVTHALVMLGWNAVKMITLGSSILAQMCGDNNALFVHSTRVAQIARFIAIEANLYKVEEFAVVGMLHDVGVNILETTHPAEYAAAKALAQECRLPLHEAEKELLGVDHAEIGGWTLEAWDLPENITESVKRHHSFDPDDYHARKTAVIHLADVFAYATDVTGPEIEKVPHADPAALAILNFSHAELKDLLIAMMKMEFEPLVM